MTPDERLEYLRQSTGSLHASMQELHAMMNAQIEESRRRDEESRHRDGKEARLRGALPAAVAAFLRGLDEGKGDNGNRNSD